MERSGQAIVSRANIIIPTKNSGINSLDRMGVPGAVGKKDKFTGYILEKGRKREYSTRPNICDSGEKGGFAKGYVMCREH